MHNGYANLSTFSSLSQAALQEFRRLHTQVQGPPFIGVTPPTNIPIRDTDEELQKALEQSAKEVQQQIDGAPMDEDHELQQALLMSATEAGVEPTYHGEFQTTQPGRTEGRSVQNEAFAALSRARGQPQQPSQLQPQQSSSLHRLNSVVDTLRNQRAEAEERRRQEREQERERWRSETERRQNMDLERQRRLKQEEEDKRLAERMQHENSEYFTERERSYPETHHRVDQNNTEDDIQRQVREIEEQEEREERRHRDQERIREQELRRRREDEEQREMRRRQEEREEEERLLYEIQRHEEQQQLVREEVARRERQRQEQAERQRELEAQDQAYQLSLQQDRERENQQRLQEELEAKKKAQEQREREEQQQQKELEEAFNLSRLLNLKAQIPESPQPGDPNAIQLVFSLPDGQKISRTFSLKNRIGDLRNFILIQQLDENGKLNIPPKFSLVTDFPRTIWSDDTVTLESTPLRKRQLFRVEPESS